MLYPNPPIQEAIFDIRVEKLENAKVFEDLERFKKFIEKKYVITKKKVNYTGKVEFAETGAQSNHITTPVALVFCTEDENNLIQVGLNGLSLNVINSYENWDKHFNEFIQVWLNYKKEFNPIKIERIATRYLNNIKLPLPVNSLQEYITYTPPIPNSKHLTNSINNFFMQVSVACKDGLRHSNITESSLPSTEKGIMPFLLDIDIYQRIGVEMTIESLKENFEQIHIIKNEVFENCITDNTRKLFS